MSTTDALSAYKQFAKYVFGDKKWACQDGSFKATRLEKAINDIVEKYSANSGSEMLDSRGDCVCKM